MKPILSIFVFLTLVVLLSSCYRGEKYFDPRITLLSQDKIPYGTSAARSLLISHFHEAEHRYNAVSPKEWSDIQTSTYHQAAIVVADRFDPVTNDLVSLRNFAFNGNTVIIIAHSFSETAQTFFQCEVGFDSIGIEMPFSPKLKQPFFSDTNSYTYPGATYSLPLIINSRLRAIALGDQSPSRTNLLMYRAGGGKIYLHSSPLTFSNYFVLYKNNSKYLEDMYALIPSDTKMILWNEYFLFPHQPKSDESEPSIFRVLLRYPSLKWGLLTGLFALILMAVLGSRRRSRRIPVKNPVKNESLEFVKTMGKLYYDRGDHTNLARKMAVIFLEHVRSVYHLQPGNSGSQFEHLLHVKSGYDENELTGIMNFIRALQAYPEELIA